MSALIAWLNTAAITAGIFAAGDGNWPGAIGLWVYAIADRLDDVARAMRVSAKERS